MRLETVENFATVFGIILQAPHVAQRSHLVAKRFKEMIKMLKQHYQRRKTVVMVIM